MPQTVTGGIQYQDLAADAQFMAAPVQDQIEYLRQDYLPKQDPAFAKAPRAEQVQYIQEAILPQLQQSAPAFSGQFDPQQNLQRFQKAVQPAVDFGGHVLAKTALPFATAAKGLTADWVDAESPLLGYLRANEARTFSPQQQAAVGIDSPIEQAQRGLAYGTGAWKSFDALAGGLNKALAGGSAMAANAGRRLLPYTVGEFSQGWPMLGQLARQGMQGVTQAQQAGKWLESGRLPAQMLRGAIEGGAYGAVHKLPEGDQFDPMARLASTTEFGLGGAAGPIIGAGAGKVLQAGIKKAGQGFRAAEKPLGLGQLKTHAKALEELFDQYVGIINHPGATDAEVIRAGKVLEDVMAAAQEERLLPDVKKLQKQGKVLEGKANFRQRQAINTKKQGKAKLPEIETKPQDDTQPNPNQKATPPEEKPQPVEKQNEVKPEPKTLKGSVKEMAEQGLGGKTYKEAQALHAQVKALGKADDDPIIQALETEKKALGRKQDDATKEARAKLVAKIGGRKAERKALRDDYGKLHGNVRELLDAGWDGQATTVMQKPVDPAKQLHLADVEANLTDKTKPIAEKINQALENGQSVRLEHQAEITGSTNQAVTVTAKGNVKVATTTFTPTHFSKTTKIVNGGPSEYVAVHGYNDAGHMRQYYLDSPEGSQILKVGKILDNEANIGIVPNVELGPRSIKVADILKKAPDVTEGVLTSEALKAAEIFREVYKTDNLNKFSKGTKMELQALKRRGDFSEESFNRLYKEMAENPEDLKTFCALFGLM